MVILENSMKLKRIFINIMILILSNYKDYCSIIDEEFDYDLYIQQFNIEDQDFYCKFVKTQMFNTFLKESEEDKTMKIKEFHQYYSLMKSTWKAKTTTQYQNFKIKSLGE